MAGYVFGDLGCPSVRRCACNLCGAATGNMGTKTRMGGEGGLSQGSSSLESQAAMVFERKVAVCGDSVQNSTRFASTQGLISDLRCSSAHCLEQAVLLDVWVVLDAMRLRRLMYRTRVVQVKGLDNLFAAEAWRVDESSVDFVVCDYVLEDGDLNDIGNVTRLLRPLDPVVE
ncbi:hypothetical protein KCV07_g214, partial [Aureobasidium melanogenum]